MKDSRKRRRRTQCLILSPMCVWIHVDRRWLNTRFRNGPNNNKGSLLLFLLIHTEMEPKIFIAGGGGHSRDKSSRKKKRRGLERWLRTIGSEMRVNRRGER